MKPSLSPNSPLTLPVWSRSWDDVQIPITALVLTAKDTVRGRQTGRQTDGQVGRQTGQGTMKDKSTLLAQNVCCTYCTGGAVKERAEEEGEETICTGEGGKVSREGYSSGTMPSDHPS